MITMMAPLIMALAPGVEPTRDPVARGIDKAISGANASFAMEASGPCDDLAFLRRVSLDLIGRTPTVAEARAFVSAGGAKRADAVERLLAHPDFNWYWAQVLDTWWMERRPSKHVEASLWMAYLRESLETAKPVDILISEIVSADGVDPAQRGRARFLLDREMEPVLVTRDISRLFLGANLQCAQCHDHPRIEGYKQEHFHGLMAYLNRAYLFDDPKLKKKVIGEKADGDVTFQSVFDPKKVTKKRSPGLPGATERSDPMLSKEQLYVSAPSKEVRGVPKYSRRLLLGEDLKGAGREALARNLANRLWAQLTGKGLIHPLDQIHPHNPASCEILMESLTSSVISAKFDLKAMLRGITLSEAYQRSSVGKPGIKGPEERFLAARLRPLSPEQMGYSMLVATGFDDAEAGAAPKALQAKREGAGKMFISALAPPAGNPDMFEPRLEQSLLMSNHPQVQSLLVSRKGNLAFRLAAAKDTGSVAEELYLAMFCRLPDADEKADVARALQGGDKPTAIADLIWALISSAEFRFIS